MIDFVATLDEIIANSFIRHLRDTMLFNETGRYILRNRSRITSKTMLVKILRRFWKNIVEQIYAKWFEKYYMSLDERDNVKYIDNKECAYIMQRYRECYNIYYAILSILVFFKEEIILKMFEFANTRLFIIALSIFVVTRLKSKERNRLFNIYLSWALKNNLKFESIINVYWEKELLIDVVKRRDRRANLETKERAI